MGTATTYILKEENDNDSYFTGLVTNVEATGVLSTVTNT
jgi:hypothetical protein